MPSVKQQRRGAQQGNGRRNDGPGYPVAEFSGRGGDALLRGAPGSRSGRACGRILLHGKGREGRAAFAAEDGLTAIGFAAFGTVFHRFLRSAAGRAPQAYFLTALLYNSPGFIARRFCAICLSGWIICDIIKIGAGKMRPFCPGAGMIKSMTERELCFTILYFLTWTAP